MSTRSIIIVTGERRQYSKTETTYRLYKHSDGYPSGNLPIIGAALSRALKQNVEQAERFNQSKADPINPEQVVGLVIGEATSVYGMGATLEQEFHEAFKVEHVGNQWDVEFVYLVDLKARSVSVFSGNFEAGIQAGVKAGPINVADEVKRYIPEAQESTRKRLKAAVATFRKSGFKLIQKRGSK